MAYPAEQPIDLKLASYGPMQEGWAPSGTLPNERLPEGVKRPLLFEPLKLRQVKGDVTLKNRVVVSPMCQYSSVDGFPTPYHLAHLGQYALHGAGAIVVEASGVVPEGRISPQDLGMYKEEHVPAHASLVASLKSFGEGVKVGLQIAHAGRKASTWAPFHRGEHKTPYAPAAQGGWPESAVGASAIPFDQGHVNPKQLTKEQIKQVEDAFVLAADRAYRAGYDFVEVHGAHGYLLSSFNSPLSNHRDDEYGGSFEKRTKLMLDIVRRIRAAHPDKALWLRVNGTDCMEHEKVESWTLESLKKLAPLVEEAGVDLLDVSGGGVVPGNLFSKKPGYQVPYTTAAKSLGLKKLLLGSVGQLHVGTPDAPEKAGLLAEKTLQDDHADVISIARGFLENPSWVEDAAKNLVNVSSARAVQYDYAVKSMS